jgi:hypothetical protein
MEDTIYLRISRNKVEGMTKSMPSLHRGEIPVKVEIRVDPAAFREPTLVRFVEVTDWREGLDFDIELRESFITETEAEVIRQRRISELVGALELRGYKVSGPDCTHGDDCPVHQGGVGCEE